MKYDGKLYGHAGGRKYFPLLLDSKDVDGLEDALRVFMEAATVDPDMDGSSEPRGWTPMLLNRAWKKADEVLKIIERKRNNDN